MTAVTAIDEGCEYCDGPAVVLRSCALSTLVAVSPQALYDVVSDVPRTGEWSPICRACWWDEGAGPQAGAWFSGRNETAERTWETRSQVVVADPGREFAFLVQGKYVRWGFTMLPHGDRTVLTESWDFRPEGIAMFHERYGEAAHDEIQLRGTQALEGIPATLLAIRTIAERPA
jgi:hypothetical protein